MIGKAVVSHRSVTLLFVILAALVAALSWAAPARAAGIVVNSAADTVADNGKCTLREAIIAANTDTASGATAGECAAGSGPDTITFAGNYTITLAGSQLPAITTPMTITGNGAANTVIEASTCDPVTLPGGCTPATYRVLEVDTGGNLTLDSLTVRHGRLVALAGGGIYNAGTLTVNGSTLSGNSAGSGGGGISNLGTLIVTGSTLSGNFAGSGGGIYNADGLTVTGSTLSGNSAGSAGGGIYNDGYDGANGEMTVTNSTLSGNSSASTGGGIFNSGQAHLQLRPSDGDQQHAVRQFGAAGRRHLCFRKPADAGA